MIVVTVNFVVESEFEKEFAAAILEQARNSIELEADCHVFEVCIATDNSSAFFLYEKYTNSDSFRAHLESEHFKSFDTLVTPWVRSKTVSQWSVAGAFS